MKILALKYRQLFNEIMRILCKPTGLHNAKK